MKDTDKKSYVRRMFDGIAPTYDTLNHMLSFNFDRRWRKLAVKCAAAGNPSRLLDVATGTGDLAIALARALPGARVDGIDISEGMLAIGRQKVADCGLDGRVSLAAGDAESMPFGDGIFDTVTIGFGIRNFADMAAGLRECLRVLKPGGRAVILEFSTPRGRIFGRLYRFYFHRILPAVGRVVSKNSYAYEYLPDSVDNFPDKLLFLRRMEEAGFARCSARRLMRGIAYIYQGTKA